MGSMDPKKFLPKLGIGGNKFLKLKKGSWNRERMLLPQREVGWNGKLNTEGL